MSTEYVEPPDLSALEDLLQVERTADMQSALQHLYTALGCEPLAVLATLRFRLRPKDHRLHQEPAQGRHCTHSARVPHMMEGRLQTVRQMCLILFQS
jgi:hypothetical protein